MVGRLVQFEGYDGKLSPAEWMALRFFARANSFSRAPSAFAELALHRKPSRRLRQVGTWSVTEHGIREDLAEYHGQKTTPPDAKEWEGKPNKLQCFSPNPGTGDSGGQLACR